jgi:hypothetical protein
MIDFEIVSQTVGHLLTGNNRQHEFTSLNRGSEIARNPDRSAGESVPRMAESSLFFFFFFLADTATI